MKGKFLFNLVVLFGLFFMAFQNSVAAKGELKIGAFNIQIFGKSKARKEDVMKIITKIVNRYDILLIQEVKDSSGTAINKLLKQVNQETKNPWGMKISRPLGKRSSEQYAYFYRKDKVKFLKDYQYENKLSRYEFSRPPYVVKFKTLEGDLKFNLIGIHTAPKNAANEIKELAKVYRVSSQKLKEKNAILLGDFNAGCSYVGPGELENHSIKSNKFVWHIGDEIDTTTSHSDCSYDRIVTNKGFTNKVVKKSARPFYFDEAYKLSYRKTKKVSDHYPVEIKLKYKARGGTFPSSRSSSNAKVRPGKKLSRHAFVKQCKSRVYTELKETYWALKDIFQTGSCTKTYSRLKGLDVIDFGEWGPYITDLSPLAGWPIKIRGL